LAIVIIVPVDFKAGVALISCAIVDTNDKPVVRFAIKDIDNNGWHPLGKIMINSPAFSVIYLSDVARNFYCARFYIEIQRRSEICQRSRQGWAELATGVSALI
jgi:hypothetical protein